MSLVCWTLGKGNRVRQTRGRCHAGTRRCRAHGIGNLKDLPNNIANLAERMRK